MIWRDLAPGSLHFVLNPANLFRLLNEFILILLGALLVFLALGGRARLPAHPQALAIAGVILIYWGARSWAGKGAKGSRTEAWLRAGSLWIVGALILAMSVLHLGRSMELLAAAGVVLVLRGLIGAGLAMRRRQPRG